MKNKSHSEPLRTTLLQAVALHQKGNLAKAARLYKAVLEVAPNQVDALHLLGVIAFQTKELQQAVDLIGKAIALRPDFVDAYANRGNALRDLKRPEEALANYDKAIALKPDFAEIYVNRGDALRDLDRPEEALASYDRAIALKQNHAAAHAGRGNALQELRRAEEAVASYDRAIALKPDNAEVYANRGLALLYLQRFEEALASYDKAIARKRNLADAHVGRGIALIDLRRFEEAVASYDKAIALKPDDADAYWNKSLGLLLNGQFEQGWRHYEWRTKTKVPTVIRTFPQPLWLGAEDIAGKTVFIHWEQGLGDTIQFCRYALLVKALGARVALSVQDPLVSLLKQLEPAIEVIGGTQAPTDFDYHCPMMSLPRALGTRLETIPVQQKYLSADPALRARWEDRLPTKTKPRIGIVWSGNTAHTNDRNRSVELVQLRPLFSGEAAWFCLQKEVQNGEAATLKQCGEISFFGEELRDFGDTAALVDLMDLVVTVDTSVAHLAGAMGKPVWIMLPFKPDWRWLLDREDSPWYPSARLLRQPSIDDWASVIERVRSQIADRFNLPAR